MNRFSHTPYRILKANAEAGQQQLIILSGGRGAGKTTWCEDLVDLARAMGLKVAGLVSPAIFFKGRKIAIDLRDVRGKETRRLAHLPAPGTPGTAGLGWRFEAETLSWGNQVIGRAIQCDLLVIDELGPLELRDNAGLSGAFAAIDARDYTLAVVVVRPELIPEALHRWPEAQVVLPLGLRSFDTFIEMTS